MTKIRAAQAYVAAAILVLGVVGTAAIASASTIYDSAISTLNTDASGFQSSVMGWVGDLLLIVLPLFALGLGWALFRRFGRQIIGFFSR